MKKLIAFVLLILLIPSSVYGQDYIVKFKDGCTEPKDIGSVITPIAEEWDMYKVKACDLSEINMSEVEFIEPDGELELLDYRPNDACYGAQWNMRLVNAPYAWERGYFGRNVRIGVIDTGVTRIYNDDIKNMVVEGKDYTGKGLEPNVTDTSPSNVSFHGTAVAGVISAEMNNGFLLAGLSQATIVPFKVCDKGESIPTSRTITAIYDAISDEYNCDVINISIGDNTSGTSTMSFEEALKKADEKGVIVTTSAGNHAEKGNPLVYPACCEHAISVGAVTYEKQRAPYSEHNTFLDVVAPGGYYTDAANVKRDEPMWMLNLSNDFLGNMGTSFSSPHVAAAAAIAKGIRPKTDFEDMMKLLKYSSEDLGDVGRDDYYGYGLLDMKELVKCLTEYKAVPYIPEYDLKNGVVSVSYLNPTDADETVYPRAVIYDENGNLLEVKEEVPLEIPAFNESELKVDNIDIPKGGYVKIFCMSDWQKLIPAGKVAVYLAE